MTPNDLTPESRVPNNGYFYVRVPTHPNATSTGYVYEHRFVMEQHLGRFLDPSEVVHHENEIKTDNRIENLELTTHPDHSKTHGAERSRAAQVSLECPECRKRFSRPRSRTTRAKRIFCSRRCNMRFHRKSGEVAPHPPAGHGSPSMYAYHKCRCDVCKQGQRDRARAYKVDRA